MQNCEQGKFRKIGFDFRGDRVTLFTLLQYFEKTICTFPKAALSVRSRTIDEDPFGLD